MTLLDGILIVVLLVGLLLGYKKGFFGTVTKPLKFIASVCITIVVAAPILNAWTRPLFVGKVETWIYDSLVESGANITAENATESMPVALRLLAQILNVDVSGIDASSGTEGLIKAISSAVAAPIGNFVAVVITYVLLFVSIMILLKILIALLDILFARGILGKINKILGLLLGGVFATVTACIIANVAFKVSPEIAGGPITEFFKNINPFAVIMKI